MMGKDDKQKKEGEFIMNNYKKQKAEAKIRELLEEEMNMSKSSRGGDDKFSAMDAPDPDILLKILEKW